MRILLVLIALVLAFEASAQRFPGRDRLGSPRDPSSRPQERSRSAMPTDPFEALEREMPSLKVDLKLNAEQVPAWRPFERDVRDLAEIGRQRTRYLLTLRDPGDHALPPASEVFARLAEEDRRRVDVATALKAHFDALYAALDEGQRRMIDRRLVQSQTEPLGQEAPPKR